MFSLQIPNKKTQQLRAKKMEVDETWFSFEQKGDVPVPSLFSKVVSSTWRTIPVSKWLITMGPWLVSPLNGVIPLINGPNGL